MNTPRVVGSTIAERGFFAWLFFAGLLLIGCSGQSNPGVSKMQRMITAGDAVTDLLLSVTDESSAMAAKDQIGPAYIEFAAAIKDGLEYERIHGPARGSQATIDQLRRDAARLKSFEKEVLRLRDRRGLPTEFWDELRFYSTHLLVVTLEFPEFANASQMDSGAVGFFRRVYGMAKEISTAKMVEIMLTNTTPDKIRTAEARLKEIAGSSARSISPDVLNSNAQLLVIGPVEDYDKFVKAVDFGTIVDKKPGQRSISIDLGRSSSIAGIGFDASSAEGKAQLKQERAAKAEEQQRDAEERRVAMEAERDRRQAEREKEKAAREHRNRKPDRDSPDYHETLVELFEDGDARHHDDAIDTLLALDTSDIQDRDLRRRIARGFKKMAFEERFKQSKGVRGMVHWGGGQAVPLLIELMQRDDRPRVEPELFIALGKLKDPRGAEAVANYLGNFFSHKEAYQSLQTMGVAAEDALIEIVPSDDAKVCLAAIALLSECGTRKSVSILSKAKRASNRQVKAAATQAVVKIRKREKEAKAE